MDAVGAATDSPPNPATDPASGWGERAWGATDRISTLTSAIGLGAALDAFCAGKAAEGLSPRSIVWYRMIGERLVGRFGAARPVDTLTATELRAWLVELRATLAPMSVAGYVRGLRAFGNWLSADGLAAARALRTLTRPRVPRKLIEPLSDADLRRLLGAAGARDRALLLLLLDTGLRVSEVVGIRLGDLRPDGSIKVLGKGSPVSELGAPQVVIDQAYQQLEAIELRLEHGSRWNGDPRTYDRGQPVAHRRQHSLHAGHGSSYVVIYRRVIEFQDGQLEPLASVEQRLLRRASRAPT